MICDISENVLTNSNCRQIILFHRVWSKRNIRIISNNQINTNYLNCKWRGTRFEKLETKYSFDYICFYFRRMVRSNYKGNFHQILTEYFVIDIK